GSVRTLDAPTGSILWSFFPPNPCRAQTPAAYGKGKGARIVVGGGRSVVELNGAGKRIWSRRTGGIVGGLGLFSAPVAGASPMMKLSLKEVIATDQAGDAYALNPKTGVIDWGDDIGAPLGEPSIANGIVYIDNDPLPGAGGGISGLNASTGDPLF